MRRRRGTSGSATGTDPAGGQGLLRRPKSPTGRRSATIPGAGGTILSMSSPTLLVRGVSALVTRGGSGREPRIRQRSCRGYLLDIMYIIGVTGALSVASDWLLRSPRGWQRLLSSSGNAPELRFRSRGLLGAGLRLQAALGVGCLMRSLDDGSVDEAVDAGSVDGWVRWQARPGCR